MGKNLKDFTRGFSKERLARIESEAQEIIRTEATLRSLREAQNLTQTSIAEILKIRQEQVSRLEQRSDMFISTLRKFIRAMGGELYLIADFPEKDPISLSGIGDLNLEKMPAAYLTAKHKEKSKKSA